MDCCAQSACLRCPRHWGRWKAAEFPASFLLTRPSTPANWSCISLSNPRFSPLSETPGRALSPSRREVLPDLPPALRTNTHLCSHRLQDPGSNACASQRLQLHQLGSQRPPSLDGAEEPSWASRSPARSRLVRCLDKGAAAAPPKSHSARARMARALSWCGLPKVGYRAAKPADLRTPPGAGQIVIRVIRENPAEAGAQNSMRWRKSAFSARQKRGRRDSQTETDAKTKCTQRTPPYVTRSAPSVERLRSAPPRPSPWRPPSLSPARSTSAAWPRPG